jgi:hypothetical protein
MLHKEDGALTNPMPVRLGFIQNHAADKEEKMLEAVHPQVNSTLNILR